MRWGWWGRAEEAYREGDMVANSWRRETEPHGRAFQGEGTASAKAPRPSRNREEKASWQARVERQEEAC